MNAVDLLIADHNRLRALFTQYRDARDGKDTATMVDVATRIFDELTVHTAIEDEIFYPGVRDVSDEIESTVDEGIQEHHVVKVLMDELSRAKGGSHEWVAKMNVLIENVEHHAGEEESDLFPPLRVPLRDELDAMAPLIDARKRELAATVAV